MGWVGVAQTANHGRAAEHIGFFPGPSAYYRSVPPLGTDPNFPTSVGQFHSPKHRAKHQEKVICGAYVHTHARTHIHTFTYTYTSTHTHAYPRIRSLLTQLFEIEISSSSTISWSTLVWQGMDEGGGGVTYASVRVGLFTRGTRTFVFSTKRCGCAYPLCVSRACVYMCVCM